MFGFLGLSLSLAGLTWASYEGYFNLESVEVKLQAQEDFKSAKIVKMYQDKLAKRLADLKGESLFSIDASNVSDKMQKHPWVDSLRLRRVFPDKLSLEIKPKPWLAYYFDGKEFFPYTNKAELLDPIPVLEGPDLPIIKLSKKELIKYKSVLLNVFASLQNTKVFNQKNLQEIALDREGLFLLIQPKGIKVRLGLEDLDLRIGRVEKVLQYLEKHDLQGRVINADFGQKVVVKLRKAR